MKNKDKNNNNKKEYYTSGTILPDQKLTEMIYRPASNDTRLVTYKNNEQKTWEKITLDNKILAPYPSYYELVNKNVIIFPSDITPYESEMELIFEIQDFIHKYLDISFIFETICAYYVLLTYLYDRLPNILYLRFIGDFGSGKSRALKVMSALCYKSMVTTGATSLSPIFRIIDTFKGTLILDEADLSNSDTYNEMIKIFNSGYEPDKPVLRSEQNSKKGFDVKAFDVYCPKVIATRFNFKDLALESRCLTEIMAKAKLRDDIPLNLSEEFEDKALELRNKLLYFRFKNFHNDFTLEHNLDKSIEPRLRQIMNTMLSIVKDEETQAMIKNFITSYHKQLVSDRSLEFEAKIIEAVFNIQNCNELENITVGAITAEYNTIRDGAKELTTGAIGKIIRNRLQIKTQHTSRGNVLSNENKERLEILFTKYGLVNEMKVMKDNPGIGNNGNINFE